MDDLGGTPHFISFYRKPPYKMIEPNPCSTKSQSLCPGSVSEMGEKTFHSKLCKMFLGFLDHFFRDTIKDIKINQG